MGSLAVTSRSFSKHPILRKEVLKRYPDAKFNDDGLSLNGQSLIDFLQGYEMAITNAGGATDVQVTFDITIN